MRKEMSRPSFHPHIPLFYLHKWPYKSFFAIWRKERERWCLSEPFTKLGGVIYCRVIMEKRTENWWMELSELCLNYNIIHWSGRGLTRDRHFKRNNKKTYRLCDRHRREEKRRNHGSWKKTQKRLSLRSQTFKGIQFIQREIIHHIHF